MKFPSPSFQVQPKARHHVASSQPGEPVVVSLQLVSAAASENPLPTASTAVLSPNLVSLINQAVQVAVQASQRQPEPAIAGPASCSGPSQWTCHPLVVDGIDPDEFAMQYTKVDQTIHMISNYGLGALIAKFNVEQHSCPPVRSIQYRSKVS